VIGDCVAWNCYGEEVWQSERAGDRHLHHSDREYLALERIEPKKLQVGSGPAGWIWDETHLLGQR
jgi:hypothetical protein